MSDWKNIVGDFAALQTNGFMTSLGKMMYMIILEQRSNIFENSGLDKDSKRIRKSLYENGFLRKVSNHHLSICQFHQEPQR